MSEVWSQPARGVDIDRGAYVGDGTPAMAVKSNVEAPGVELEDCSDEQGTAGLVVTETERPSAARACRGAPLCVFDLGTGPLPSDTRATTECRPGVLWCVSAAASLFWQECDRYQDLAERFERNAVVTHPPSLSGRSGSPPCAAPGG